VSRKIQQHMYTRERKGIFHDTAGYDTIAVSEGLKSSFVKKYLHPFCFYHSPKTLRELGEIDPSCYPPAVTIFQPETGDLVIGQAVFIPADFTGTRSAFFMHTYVIPPLQSEEWVRHPERLFHIDTFQTAYDPNNGPVLPELDLVPVYDTTSILKDEILEILGISHAHFQMLLFAVMTSVSGKKKVFISLDVPLQEYTKYALMLLELLNHYLPYAFRRNLGVITFTSEPETRKYIHVTFFEPGTLPIHDRSIEKQFIFDFAGQFISGVSNAVEQIEFLGYALQRFKAMEKMDEFFHFAERALTGLAEEEKCSLESYNQLTGLFLTLTNGNFQLYLEDKPRFLNCLVKYLQTEPEEKPQLVELFLKILGCEKIADEPAIARYYMESLVSVNSLVRLEEIRSFLLETLHFYREDKLYLELWKIIERDRFTYESLVGFISGQEDYEYLVGLYLKNRMKDLSLEDIRGLGKLISDELITKLKDDTTQDYFLLLQVLSKLVNPSTENALDFIKLLTRKSRGQLSQILQKLLGECSSPKPLPLFLAAFQTMDDDVDFLRLLDFISGHYNEMALFSFIKENANLVATEMHYRSSLKAYLVNHPHSIWKDKKWRKELRTVNDLQFKLLIKEVGKESTNPLVRFLKKNGLKDLS